MSLPAASLRRVATPGRRTLLEAVERHTGLTPTGLAVAGAAAACWGIAYLIGSRALYTLAYAAALMLAATAVAGRRRPAIAARRSTLPVRVREGQVVHAEIEVEGKGRLVALVVEEQLERIRRPVRLLVAALRAGGVVRHAYTFSPALRGLYRIGPLVAVWSDPFGLVRRRTPIVEATELIVHPSVELVHDRVLSREWEDPPVRPPVSKPWPTGFEFYGMRDYVPGDDPRRIVWRAVARTDRYLVRVAEQGITDRVTIVLDDDASTHSPGDPSDTFETAVRAVASLACRHLEDGFLVSVESPGGAIVRGARGRRERIRVLDAMARLRLGRVALPSALQRVLGDPRRDTHHILVAPHLDHRAAAMLKLLLDRGGSMTFVHVVTEESDPLSIARASTLGCELVKLTPGAALESVFRRGTGAGIRR